MEMPEQELPILFSQMLQMFPNIPHDIIWMYVQRYSRDIEKCAQMLNLQSSKYTGMKQLDSSTNLNDCDNVIQIPNDCESTPQIPHFRLQSEIDNNNVLLPEQTLFLNNASNVTKRFINEKQTVEMTCNLPFQSSVNSVYENSPVDSPRNPSETKFTNFNEPLILHIVPDDDDISHSWRPNVSADVLCSDLFLPSPMSENFHLTSNAIPSVNCVQDNSEILMNPGGINQDSWEGFNNSTHIFYDFNQQNQRFYEKDTTGYLHYQKSEMNTIRYEVIKSKIDLSDLRESVEKLSFELKEKMQSKSLQDIQELNEEIVQLRLECQCLCTDVDHLLNNQGLLGEVDERCYEKEKSASNSTGVQSITDEQCANSNVENNDVDVHSESSRWQCPKCTFANHSAISVCEMCNVAKPSRRPPPFLHATPSSCYCHPKEKSLSVHS